VQRVTVALVLRADANTTEARRTLVRLATVMYMIQKGYYWKGLETVSMYHVRRTQDDIL